MGICHHLRFGSSDRHDDPGERSDERQDQEHPAEVEDEVSHRGPPGMEVHPHRGDEGRRGRTDVCAEQERDRLWEGEQPLLGEDNSETGCHRA